MQGRVDIDSEKYPDILRKIPNPPKALYYKGVWREDLFDNCLGMVGSRRMSVYGRKVVSHLLTSLHKGITVVSGFMSGVDAESHAKALDNGLSTIAVMPCGIDYIHPENQEELYYQIIEKGGLIISEFEGDFKPKLWTYPKRNRIISGLCQALVVIEGSVNSGSLITAGLSNKYGRAVFAVPGSIFNNLSKGPFHLIGSYAKPLSSGLEINKFYNLELPLFKSTGLVNDTNSSNNLLDILKQQPQTIDSLSEETNIPISLLNSKVTLLVLNNKIIEEQGVLHAC